jgi:site-specific DNA recombinase
MFGIFAWLYEQESQRTGERIKSALQTRSRQGLFQGSIPPYGYELCDGKLYLKEDNTPSIVRRIFKEYMQGKGFDRIARELYNEGYPTPAQIAEKSNGSDKWHGSSIRSILMNPHYTGDLVQGRQTTRSVTCKVRDDLLLDKFIVVEGTHQALVSKQDFNAIQALIETRNESNLMRRPTFLQIHYVVLIVKKECILRRTDEDMFVALTISMEVRLAPIIILEKIISSLQFSAILKDY